jgi:hypothetical protein
MTYIYPARIALSCCNAAHLIAASRMFVPIAARFVLVDTEG